MIAWRVRTLDKTLPAGVQGVKLSQIDAPRAVPACRAALRDHPLVPRIAYQLGRALAASNNHSEAIALFKEAAEESYALAMLALGTAYEEGKGAEQSYPEAKRWFEKAGSLGQPQALNELGAMYENGWGITKDPIVAKEWYERAAVLGSQEGMNNLGILFQNGAGVPKSSVDAKSWFNKAAELGDTIAMLNLGNLYSLERDFSTAETWFKKAAQKGSAKAMVRLGIMHNAGNDAFPKNVELAKSWFETAAANNEPEAYYHLGRLAENITRANDFYHRARELFEKEAAAGKTRAMIWLGRIYASGDGVERNTVTAKIWFSKANLLGDTKAKVNLEALPAIEVIAVNADCNPPSSSGRKDPPQEHIYYHHNTENSFFGSLDYLAFREEESEEAKNTSTDIHIYWPSANYVYTSSAPYSVLDPDVQSDGSKVRVHCRVPNCFHTTKQTTIAGVVEDGNIRHSFPVRTDKSSRQTYEFCDAATATKIAKALSFLIKLHGGTNIPDFASAQ